MHGEESAAALGFGCVLEMQAIGGVVGAPAKRWSGHDLGEEDGLGVEAVMAWSDA